MLTGITFHGTSITAGITNGTAHDFGFATGQSTGLGAGGDFVFQTAPSGTTGSTVNPLVTAMTIKSDGNIGIGTTNPSGGAILELSSTTQAFIVPRMTSGQRSAITAEIGMIIYNTILNQLQFYDGTSWVNT